MKKYILPLLLALGISQAAKSQTMTGSITQIPCNDDGIFSVSVTGIPLPITYTYYFDGGTVVHSNVNSTTDELTDIPMGRYGTIYCQASGSGLYASAQDTYTPSFEFDITGDSPFCPATLGTINANQISGSTGPFSFIWTNSITLEQYFGNDALVPEGSYSGEIIDETSGCKFYVQDSAVFIQQQSDITSTFEVTPANCTNGTVNSTPTGGLEPYTYQWSNGSTNANMTGLSGGYYDLLITDAQGCHSNNLGVYVPQGVTINVNTTITNATCLQNDGSAMAFGSGGVNPYTYVWNNGQTGNNATGLSGGNYTVVATDANGCVGTTNVYIGSNTPINVTYSSTSSDCTSPTGSASLYVSGGTAPYHYFWNVASSNNSASISNLAPGTYAFVVTDADGCQRNGSVVIPPISVFGGEILTSGAVCPNIYGTATAQVYGGQAPIQYLWSNGSTSNSITGVQSGTYSCVITDVLGCSIQKYGTIQNISPLNIGVLTEPTSCLYSSDGSATVMVTGGTSPYTYVNTDGSNSALASSLDVGSHYIQVIDADGCSGTKYFYIDNANTNQDCYCTISGDVFVDANNNCVQDSGEEGVTNMMIHCSGYGYQFTDANGHYSFKVPTGTYTISQNINQYYPLSSCQNNDISLSVVAASGCNNVVNFANVINPLHDLKIVTMNATVPPIPGMPYQQKIIIKNEGTIAEATAQLGYERDEQIPFTGANLSTFGQLNSAASPNNYSVQSGFPNLNPGENTVLLLNYLTPVDLPLGTEIIYYDSVASQAPIAINWLNDNSPWNNVNTFTTPVIGAYDPNYKEVSPKGVGSEGFVSSEVKEFDYVIHFQNEGTYYAQKIVVTDQLDEDFDWTTFKPGYSDHTYSAAVSETGLVTFTFDNINLPWKSQFGDVLSSGLVSYSIQRKLTTPVGTEFTNTANIYFDYNAPIITNTTHNTLTDSISGLIEKPKLIDEHAVTVDVYPVPVSDNLTIQINNIAKNEEASVHFINLLGNVMLSEKIALTPGSTVVTKNLSMLKTGTYLVQIQFENGLSVVKKIVISND
jgi:hypothetical protein